MGIMITLVVKSLLTGLILRTFGQRKSGIYTRFALALLFLLPGISARAQHSPQLSEYHVKAAFLYKFALFVDWPPETFADNSVPYIFGILGTDPFGDLIEETLADKKLNNRPIVIKRYTDYKKIGKCHILFISNSENVRWKPIFQHLETAPILTVGETDGFAAKGGIINFINEDHKIRFEINHATAQAHQLLLSSKLLRLAKIVK
jgi:hypothetical protein